MSLLHGGDSNQHLVLLEDTTVRFVLAAKRLHDARPRAPKLTVASMQWFIGESDGEEQQQDKKGTAG